MMGTAGGRPFDVPKGTKWVEIYGQPVPGNWGPARLVRFLKEEHGIEPGLRQAFLFFNKARDRLKLYYRQADGDQLVEKQVTKGGFILPVGDPDTPFIKVSPKKLATLFRA